MKGSVAFTLIFCCLVALTQAQVLVFPGIQWISFLNGAQTTCYINGQTSATVAGGEHIETGNNQWGYVNISLSIETDTASISFSTQVTLINQTNYQFVFWAVNTSDGVISSASQLKTMLQPYSPGQPQVFSSLVRAVALNNLNYNINVALVWPGALTVTVGQQMKTQQTSSYIQVPYVNNNPNVLITYDNGTVILNQPLSPTEFDQQLQEDFSYTLFVLTGDNGTEFMLTLDFFNSPVVNVRFFNGLFDPQEACVLINDEQFTCLGFGQISPWTQIPEGNKLITIESQSNSSLRNTVQLLFPEGNYTFQFWGNLTEGMNATNVTDNVFTWQQPNQAQVKFFDFSEDFNTTLGSAALAVSNTTIYDQITSDTVYVPFHPQTYKFQYQRQQSVFNNTMVNIGAPQTLTLMPNRSYTLYAVGIEGGNPPFQLIVVGVDQGSQADCYSLHLRFCCHQHYHLRLCHHLDRQPTPTTTLSSH